MPEILDADLVLEGGGVKGIGLVGAYSVFADQGYQIHRVAGTSAGAIVGALIAAGMSAAEMQKVMETVDYRRFEDGSIIDRIPGLRLLGVVAEKGLYEGKELRNWIADLLQSKGVRTFGDLKITEDPDGSLPPEKSYRLVVMASDITNGQLIRLPWDYHLYGLDPDKQLVADAVRASMSIPFFYEPVTLETRGDHDEITTCYLVDGGMLSNYPITVFDRTDGAPPRWPTFGIKLSAQQPTGVGRFDVDDEFFGLTKALIGTLTSFHDRMHVQDPAVIDRTIFVDTQGVKATDFDIDELTQQTLLENGRLAAEKFFKGGWKFEDHLAKFPRQPTG